MHVTPLIYGASQLHVHASAILSDPLRYLRLIEEKVCDPWYSYPHMSDWCLISIQSIELAFAPNFLLAKLTRDLQGRTDLFGQFNLSSLRRINSGGEAVVSSTAVAFSKTLKNLAKNGDASFVISAGFGMTETW